MKRGGPLKRRAPLARGDSELKRTPLRRTGSWSLERGGWTKVPERTRMERRIQEGVRRRVFARDGGRCVARAGRGCTGQAEHAHHVILRSRGGPDTEENEISVCHWCHRWIHDHPKLATERGWMRSANG